VALIVAMTGIIIIIYSDTTFRSEGMLGALLVVMATVGASGFKVRTHNAARSTPTEDGTFLQNKKL